MAVGDYATSVGYPLVPNTGEEGRIRYGAREINRSRDFTAQVKLTVPIGKNGFRTASGISSGSSVPDAAVGLDGDIYFKII